MKFLRLGEFSNITPEGRGIGMISLTTFRYKVNLQVSGTTFLVILLNLIWVEVAWFKKRIFQNKSLIFEPKKLIPNTDHVQALELV